MNNNLKYNIVQPKIYVIDFSYDIERRSISYISKNELWLGTAYSIDDALIKIKKNKLVRNLQVIRYKTLPILSVIKNCTNINVDEIRESMKNNLMGKIIQSKSVELLESSKDLLTTSEYKYVIEQFRTQNKQRGNISNKK